MATDFHCPNRLPMQVPEMLILEGGPPEGIMTDKCTLGQPRSLCESALHHVIPEGLCTYPTVVGVRLDRADALRQTIALRVHAGLESHPLPSC